MKQCKCGCGQTIPDSRVFVDKVHQTAWMRNQAETAGYGHNSVIEVDSKPVERTSRSWDGSGCYAAGFALTGFVAFIASWIYCIATYGFLFGLGLGWLPSMILAVIVGAAWPLLLFAVAVGAFIIFGSG